MPNLFTKMGDGLYTRKGSVCPFCNEKDGWSVYQKESQWFFKCFGPNCVANNPEYGHNEIGYIILRRSLTRNEAAQLYLSLALPDEYQPSQPKPPHEKPEPRNFSAREGPARNIWHNLYKRLRLTPGDREKISRKRGLNDETIDALGFKSNNSMNEEVLKKLADELGVEQLVAEGLFIDDRRSLRPAGQFCGCGITDKKKEDGTPVFERNEPPLIPYLNEDGIPFYIRPHKGGVKKPGDEEEEDRVILEAAGEDIRCSSHVYCPFTISDLIASFDGRCILTEGEWKVAALFQCGIPAIAVPGITFIRNPTFKKELLAILKDCGVTEVIVIFDNEVKDDPNFPSRYKPDPSKRYETQGWAEFTAADLRKPFGKSVKLAWLPDELRVDGKADFDGVLSGFVHGVPGHKIFATPLGFKEGTTRAAKVFRGLMEGATQKSSQQDLFPSEARRYIEAFVAQKFHTPFLASGGDKEAALARKFNKISDHTGLPIDPEMADKLRKIAGCYYERKAVVKEIRAQYEEELSSLNAALRRHDEKEETLSAKHINHIIARKAAVHEWLRGVPKPISDSIIKCAFKLHSGAITHRLVTIKNYNDTIKDPTMWRLSPEHLGRLSNFREFCYGTGKAVWHGGDEALQFLVRDMDMESYMRDIHEVNLYGYHEESKIWFFGDCAFVSVLNPQTNLFEAKRIEADKTNVFWHEGIGYQVDASIDERGSSFAQGAPLMLSPHGAKPKAEPPELSRMFTQLCTDFHDTIGGYEGWLALGMVFAYGVAPEMLKLGGHPGLWLSGKMSGGKTSIARWLMRIWGFKELPGLSLGESTPVAINRILAQYCDLPVWFDEFRKDEVDAQKVYVLRHAFDRGGAGKGLPDYTVRTRMAGSKSTPIVTGETGSTDAATRSRYVQIQVSANKRIGDGAARYTRMNDESRYYFLLGRAIMEKRPAFHAHFSDHLANWTENSEIRAAVPNERSRFVHGVAYASLVAIDEILQAKLQGLNAFSLFLQEHARESLKESMDETFINTWWRDVGAGLQTKKIKDTSFLIAYVNVAPDGKLKEATDDDTNGIWVLYMAADALYVEYAESKRSRNEQILLDYNGLRRELTKEPYWIPAPKDTQRKHKKSIRGAQVTTWVLSLERKDATPDAPHLFPYVTDLIPLLADVDTMSALIARGILTEEDRNTA